MKGAYHILNGDALLEQFPDSLEGTKIIARECLVDGPVTSTSLEALFTLRAEFLSETYQACTRLEYEHDVVLQFKQIQQIPSGADIYLWFEDDLFCQVNKWFVLYLLQDRHDCNLYEIRPDARSPYGFSIFSSKELHALFEVRKALPLPNIQTQLWVPYAEDDLDRLQQLAASLPPKAAYISQAIDAHIARLPSPDSLGLPKETIQAIMEELDTDAFGPVFRAFQERLPIYGFGDLQVKRMWESLRKGM